MNIENMLRETGAKIVLEKRTLFYSSEKWEIEEDGETMGIFANLDRAVKYFLTGE